METYDVQFLQEALDDLEEIVLYIAQDSRQAALRMHDKMIEAHKNKNPNGNRKVAQYQNK